METKKKVAHRAAQVGKQGRPRKDGKKTLSVNAINEIIYPGFQHDLTETLKNIRYDPAAELIKKLQKVEYLFEAKADTLSAQELSIYLKTWTSALTAMFPYVYTKRPTDVSVQSLHLKADYSDYIEQLHQKAVEKIVDKAVVSTVTDQELEDKEDDDED